MAELAVAMTYGEALFEAAKELNKTAEIGEDLKALDEIFKAEPDFFAFLDSPGIPAREKKQTINNIFAGKMNEELINFVFILIDKCRLNAFKQIVKVYQEKVNHEEGVSYGKIVSVKPLTEQQLTRFEAETGKLLQGKVKLTNEIDSGLIGGVIIYVDGKIIDASIKNRLQVLADNLMLNERRQKL